MQFKRNRRFMLAQDIVLVCLIPILCFFCIGSIQIGSWNIGEMFTIDPASSEIMEECIDDFYIQYVNSEGNELGETISFSPLGIWKSVGQTGLSLFKGILHRTVSVAHFSDMPADVFADCAGTLVIFHIIKSTLSTTIFQGLLYLTLFTVTAITPLICITQMLHALTDLIAYRKEPRDRHRKTVLTFRKAVRPLFVVLLMTLLLPDVKPAAAWVYAMGVFLLCLVWNFIASRAKHNTGNEKEFLSFIQFFSLGGLVLMIGALAAMDRSNILSHLYDRVCYAGGLDIILDCFDGNFNVPNLLLLIFVALFLAGLGLALRYLYYALLKVACIMESSRHKKVYHEGLVAIAAVALGMFGSSYFLFEASGQLELVLTDTEFIAFIVALALTFLVLVLEIIQRALCHANRLDREYRNDLLCGCTDDRLYSTEAAIREAEEKAAEKIAEATAPAKETPVEDTPVEDTPVEDTPAEDTPIEDTPAEDTPAEDTPVEDATVEDTPVEDTPVEEAPVEDAPVEDATVEEAPVEEAPVEGTPVEEAPVEDATVEDAPVEDTPVEDTPVEDTPVEDATVEDAPVEDAPVEDAPVEETPVEDTPVEDTPVEDTPVEDTPVEDTPAEDTPIEDTPVEDTPVEDTPTDDTPAEDTSAEN